MYTASDMEKRRLALQEHPAIADVYDALVNERVYKSAFSKEKAFQMIVTGECGVFSPKLLECFWNARRQFETLAEQVCPVYG